MIAVGSFQPPGSLSSFLLPHPLSPLLQFYSKTDYNTQVCNLDIPPVSQSSSDLDHLLPTGWMTAWMLVNWHDLLAFIQSF